MSGPALLVLVRHGFSVLQEARRGSLYLPDEGAKRILLGRADREIPLSRRGYRHALRTGRLIRERFGEFDCFYASTYLRARQTALAIRRAYPPETRRRTPFLVSSCLDERSAGDTFGLTEAEVEEKFPWLRAHREERGEFFARFPGGDTMEDVCRRAREFIREISAGWAGGRVCAAGHWGSVLAIRHVLEGWDPDRTLYAMGTEHPDNCSLTVYAGEGPSGRLVLRHASMLLCECEAAE